MSVSFEIINLGQALKVSYPIKARIELEKMFKKSVPEIMETEIQSNESLAKILAVGLKYGEGSSEYTEEKVIDLLTEFEPSQDYTAEVIQDALGKAAMGPKYEALKKKYQEIQDKFMNGPAEELKQEKN